jgi:hypothetical protein
MEIAGSYDWRLTIAGRQRRITILRKALNHHAGAGQRLAGAHIGDAIDRGDAVRAVAI